MPSYTHNFIKNIVYSNNDNNAENKTSICGEEFRRNSTGTTVERSEGKESQGKTYKESTRNTRTNRERLSYLSTECRRAYRNIQSLQRSVLQGKWRTQGVEGQLKSFNHHANKFAGIESRLIELNFKYPNLFYYLMLIDTAFTDITLVINLTNIQNLLKTIGVY